MSRPLIKTQPPPVNYGAIDVKVTSPQLSREELDLGRRRVASIIRRKGASTVANQDSQFERTTRALTIATVFCVVFMIVEVVAGYLAHSLAILTDAAHLLTDVGSYMLSLVALHAARRAATSTYSYGWHRAEVVGTLLSVFTIWALVGGVTIEAINRMRTMEVCSNHVAFVAPDGRLVNAVSSSHATGHGTAAAAAAVSEGAPKSAISHADAAADSSPAVGKRKASNHASSEKVGTPEKDSTIVLRDANVKRVPLPPSAIECEAVDPITMMVVGLFGIIVNIVCAGILDWGGHQHSHGGKACTGHGGAGGDHGHSHGEDHGHAHGGGGSGDEAHHGCSGGGDHGHSHDDDHSGHDHGDHSGHDHSGCHDDHSGHDHGHDDHGHSHGDEDHTGHDHGSVVPSASSSPSKQQKQSAADAAPPKSLALRAAYIHALGDSIQSAGVILAGFAIWKFNQSEYGVSAFSNSKYNMLDPACSILFAVITLLTTRGIVSNLFGILMESTPPSVDYEQLNEDLKAIDCVASVHDLHVWSLTHDRVALSVHLVSNFHEDALMLAQHVCVSHGILHTTIQVDSEDAHAVTCQQHMGCHA